MKDFQLIPYCAQTSCIDCEHTLECKIFYENHGRLPYLFYKPYVKTDIEYLMDKLDVPVPETFEAVVHCKDCKYSERDNDLYVCTVSADSTYRKEDHFCSFAERRESE